MKKLCFIVIALAMCLASQAQLRTSRTYVKEKKRPIEWIVRVGMSLDNMNPDDFIKENSSLDGDKMSTGSVVNPNLTISFNKYFGKSQLYWGAELGYTTFGGKLSYKGYLATSSNNDAAEPFTIDSKVTHHCLMFSPVIGYKFNVNEKIQINPHVGPYAVWNIEPNEKETTSSNITKENGCSYFDLSSWDTFCFGYRLGVGVWYDRFNFDVTFQKNLTKPDINYYYKEYYSADNHFYSIILSLGVRF